MAFTGLAVDYIFYIFGNGAALLHLLGFFFIIIIIFISPHLKIGDPNLAKKEVRFQMIYALVKLERLISELYRRHSILSGCLKWFQRQLLYLSIESLQICFEPLMSISRHMEKQLYQKHPMQQYWFLFWRLRDPISDNESFVLCRF